MDLESKNLRGPGFAGLILRNSIDPDRCFESDDQKFQSRLETNGNKLNIPAVSPCSVYFALGLSVPGSGHYVQDTCICLHQWIR